MVFAVLAPVVLAAVAAAIPQAAVPYVAHMFGGMLSLLNIDTDVSWWFGGWRFAPSPVLVVGHLGLMSGGWLLNTRRHEPGYRILVACSVVLVAYMAPASLLALIAWLLRGGDTLQALYETVVSTVLAAAYLGALIGVFFAARRAQVMTVSGGTIPPYLLARRLGGWVGVLVMIVVAGGAVWRLMIVPLHQFNIVNGTGRDIVPVSFQVDDLLIPYNPDAVLQPDDGKTKSIYYQNILFRYKRISVAKVVVKFRYIGASDEIELVSELDARPRFECLFFITIQPKQLRTSECLRPELYDFD